MEHFNIQLTNSKNSTDEKEIWQRGRGLLFESDGVLAVPFRGHNSWFRTVYGDEIKMTGNVTYL